MYIEDAMNSACVVRILVPRGIVHTNVHLLVIQDSSEAIMLDC